MLLPVTAVLNSMNIFDFYNIIKEVKNCIFKTDLRARSICCYAGCRDQQSTDKQSLSYTTILHAYNSLTYDTVINKK